MLALRLNCICYKSSVITAPSSIHSALGLTAMSTPRVNTMSAAERVGQLLGNDLAGRVIECFDFCVIQNRVAACVSVRWSTLAAQRRVSLENAFWDEPGPRAVEEAHLRMDAFNDGMQETIAQNAAAAAATSLGDPVADRLRRLGRTRGAHVVDAGESSVASYVTYAEYLPTNGRKQRVLIVARDEELGKWVAAFSGKPYYRGDFDACPNFAEYDYDAAEPLDVFVCSDQCMRRHWDAFFAINSDRNQISRPRFAIVVDAGAGNAHTIMPLISLDLSRLAGSCHVVSKPLPPAGMPRIVNGAGPGLDLVEALFRLHWVNALMADLAVEPLLRRGTGPHRPFTAGGDGPPGVLHPPGEPVLRPGLATTDDAERGRYKFLWEVIRIDICERLVEEWYHINVQAAAAAEGS